MERRVIIMRKWYQKSMAVLTAAACLFAGGTIGFARDSLPQLQLAAEAEESTYIEAAYGLQLKYDYLSDGTIEITKFVSSTSSDIELPSVIDGKSVTSIGYRAFNADDIEACSNLTSIIIPDSVTGIGDYAFYNCTSLTDVTIPDSVTSIGMCAFEHCESLTDVMIPGSVTSIGWGAFRDCINLIDVTIPDGVTSIESFAFQNCTSLTTVTIPDSVTSIGGYAFYNCTSLKSITIPNSVTSIGDWVFEYCTSLTIVMISDSVTSIGDGAFSECTSLTEIIVDSNNKAYASKDGILFDKNFETIICCPGGKIGSFTIPDSVTNIGYWAFYSCIGLTSVVIPDSVTSIGVGTFKLCTSLTEIVVDSNNKSYASKDDILFDKNFETIICCPGGKIGSFTIPDSVTSIGESAFAACTSLTDVTIPDSVTSIGYGAFRDCTSLTDVTIPNSVISIGDLAFFDCDKLTDIYYKGSEPEWNQISIGSLAIPSNVTIHYESEPVTTTTTTTMTTTTTTTKPTTTTTTTTKPTTTTTVTTTTTAAYTFTPGADNWSFLNSTSNFKHPNYFILDSYYDKLMDGLTNVEKNRVNELLELPWGGSCYGMAITSILAADDILNPSDWQDGANFLSDIDGPPSQDVESLINYYMALQKTDVIQNKIKNFLYLTEKEKLQVLIDCLEDDSPTLLAFYNTGHAVVAYDLQYGTYSIKGNAYNGKVLIYDNNDNTFGDTYCLYFNSSKGTWCIPHYSNANKLILVSDDINLINHHGYINGSNAPVESTDSFIASLQSDPLKSDYSVTKIDLDSNNDYVFSATNPDEIKEYSDLFDDNENPQNLKFAMKDASKGYALKLATTEAVDLSMRYENSIFDVTGSNGNIAVFDPSGYVSLEGSDTTYNFNMIYNDGYHTTDWYSFQVDGNHVDAANMKQTENGYVLHADSLNNVTAQAYNDNATAKVTFSTDYTDVLLYEIDEETIGVAVDTNGDGTYETTIAKSDNTSEDTVAYGDVNTDNVVDLRDTIVLNKYLANIIQFSDVQMANADCYKDGNLDEKDASTLMQFVISLIQDIPVIEE